MNALQCPRCLDPLPGDAPEGLCPTCLLDAGLQVSLLDSSPSDRGGLKPPNVRVVDAAFPTLDVKRLIGRGGMGAVYEAFDTSLNRTVALKVLPPELASDPQFADRFLREAKAMALLNHPNVVHIYRAGEQDEFLYLLIEYVAGKNLRQLVRAEGPLSLNRCLNVLHQIAAGLAYAHERGVIHRDVKPENILVGADGLVKLADFGLAKLAVNNSLAMTLTRAHQALGTPHYMAPEQLERPDEVEEPADVFAFGVVAYELLTGRLPLGRFPDPSKINPRLHLRYDPVVIRCLETDHADRFANGGELLSALNAAGPNRTALTAALSEGLDPGDPSGTPSAKVRLLSERVASGQIEPRRLRLAAFLGDGASREALKAHGESVPSEGHWAAALAYQEAVTCLEVCLVALRISRGGEWKAGRFVDPVLTRAFRAVETWCRRPDPISLEATSALAEELEQQDDMGPRRRSAYEAARLTCQATLLASRGEAVNALATRAITAAEKAVGAPLIRSAMRDELVQWLVGLGELGPLPSASELNDAFEQPAHAPGRTWHSFNKTPSAYRASGKKQWPFWLFAIALALAFVVASLALASWLTLS
jgi:hypothetical protein